MKMLITDNFENLILNKIPLIDTRAPIEFKKGAFKSAINLPLLTDKEREVIGTCYKNSGSDAAIKLGYKMISGDIKEQRVNAWVEFIKEHPDSVIYCFRGGQRSSIAQQWLYEAGYPIAKIKGGYKAFRNYILEQFTTINKSFNPIRLGGYTGSGKTILLNKLSNSIDLEGLANHRGSAFGRHIVPQPTQINFENNLLFDLKRKIDKGYKNLIFEDESKNIGRVYIPDTLHNYLVSSKMVILKESMENRVDIIFQEYVINSQLEYKDITLWANDMLSSFDRIKRRLGGKRHKELVELFNNSFLNQKSRNNLEQHKLWIEKLLIEYYDPMYSYQLDKNRELIEFIGGKEEVLEYFINSSIDI